MRLIQQVEFWVYIYHWSAYDVNISLNLCFLLSREFPTWRFGVYIRYLATV